MEHQDAELARLARAYTQVIVEALAGWRSIDQINHLLRHAVALRLRQRPVIRQGHPTDVATRYQRAGDGHAIEVWARYRLAEQVHALAYRLERREGRPPEVTAIATATLR